MNTKMPINESERPKTIAQILVSDNFKQQLTLALPRHLTADRFSRIALTEIRRNPELEECDQKSFLGAIIQCSQLGLEPGDALGRAYLIPFNNKKMSRKECQLIIGYRGLLDLTRRSGTIKSVCAQCVYENDFFEYEYGFNEKLRHIPSQEERGDFKCVYAFVKFKGGGHEFDVLSKKDVEKIRASSKTANSSYSPWNTHYGEMARKTILRRLTKILPMSIEAQQAVILDEAADVGKQNFGHLIDITESHEKSISKEPTQVEKLTDTLQKEKEVTEEKSTVAAFNAVK